MQVLLNSDHHVTGDETLTQRVESIVGDTLGRFADRITRVEVHLNDVNGHKLGDRDKRCMMEARLGGMAPIAVTHHAPTFAEAIEAAAEKLERAIEHSLGRLQDTAGPAPAESEIASIEQLEELRKAARPARKSS
jgi:ribosome-associated translation inhibitor RaiA